MTQPLSLLSSSLTFTQLNSDLSSDKIEKAKQPPISSVLSLLRSPASAVALNNKREFEVSSPAPRDTETTPEEVKEQTKRHKVDGNTTAPLSRAYEFPPPLHLTPTDPTSTLNPALSLKTFTPRGTAKDVSELDNPLSSFMSEYSLTRAFASRTLKPASNPILPPPPLSLTSSLYNDSSSPPTSPASSSNYPHSAGTPFSEASPFSSFSPKMQVPTTPFKSQTHLKITAPFASKAYSISNTNVITYNHKYFPIAAVPGLCGEHSQIYTLNTDVPFDPLVENANIFIKVFKPNVIAKDRDLLDKWIGFAMEQYDRVKNAGLPVVTIYNRDTVMTDGFVACKKLKPYLPLWTREDTLDSLSDKAKHVLTQIIAFCQFAFNDPSNVPLDLKSDNLGYNSEGKITLLDFMERDDPDPFAFRLTAAKCLWNLANRNSAITMHILESCKLDSMVAIGLDPETVRSEILDNLSHYVGFN